MFFSVLNSLRTFLLLSPQFVEVEGQITSIVDLYPAVLRKGYRREIFIAVMCFMSYLLGLAMVTKVSPSTVTSAHTSDGCPVKIRKRNRWTTAITPHIFYMPLCCCIVIAKYGFLAHYRTHIRRVRMEQFGMLFSIQHLTVLQWRLSTCWTLRVRCQDSCVLLSAPSPTTI